MFSNVEFKSNLYPLKDYFIYDKEFLSQIHDVFALEILKRNYDGKISDFEMSDVQTEEYKTASGHCAYAKKGDYVWGTVIDSDGKKRVVCKCTKQNCRNFKRCRKDFNPAELKIVEENKNYHSTVSKKIFESELVKSAEKIEKPVEEIQPVVKIEKPAEEIQPVVKIEKTAEKIQPVVKTEPVEKNFSSFVEITQEKIIESAPDEKIIVNGGPGTGKTWTLIQKIIYMVEAQNISADNILVFCFSCAAVDVVKSRNECQNIDIRTFDSFATYLLAFAKNDKILPSNYEFGNQNYDQRISQAVSILKENRNILDAYDGGHIFIDEVQDLVGVRAELVIELLKTIPENCGFTLFGDSCQSLYDYLSANDAAVMSSEKFYKNIFEIFPKAKYFSLTENHRQGDNLKNLIAPYREKILAGNASKCLSVLEEKFKIIPKLETPLKYFTQEMANKYLNKGTLGILTRTNGQALQISSWLKSNEIRHTLQRSSRNLNFGDWISQIFFDYKNSTISEKDFIQHHQQIYNVSSEIAIKRWNALANTQSEIRPRYEVENLLQGILNNAKDNILFESGNAKSELITVSNIHRAKGREFDSVILIDEVLNAENILEHKIFYVALTRAKEIINLAEMPTQYNYIIPNENRRCFKATKNFRTGKFYLSDFEVGIVGDVNIFSLCTEEIQNFIANDLNVGANVILEKCPEDTKEFVTYKIIVEEPKYFILGYTGKIFAAELAQALKRIFNLSADTDIFYSHYPNTFDNVYIDEIFTCIFGANRELPAAKNWGDMKLWRGFSIGGLAKVVKDTF